MDNREEIINEILELTNELTVEEVRTFIKMFEESKKAQRTERAAVALCGRCGNSRPTCAFKFKYLAKCPGG